jgi:hypothetical protein
MSLRWYDCERMSVTIQPFSLDRVVSAVEKVKQRLLRAAAVLENEKVLYAVAGGNAVALWVSRVDEAAVRNTQDVDILIRREDFERVKQAMEKDGFIYRHIAGLDAFLDGPQAKAREAVQIVFANEKVRPQESAANPDVTDSEMTERYRVLSLGALVRVKLTAFRDKDRVHLRDLIEVGLIDAGWIDRLPSDLGQRLKSILDNPQG